MRTERGWGIGFDGGAGVGGERAAMAGDALGELRDVAGVASLKEGVGVGAVPGALGSAASCLMVSPLAGTRAERR